MMHCILSAVFAPMLLGDEQSVHPSCSMGSYGQMRQSGELRRCHQSLRCCKDRVCPYTYLYRYVYGHKYMYMDIYAPVYIPVHIRIYRHPHTYVFILLSWCCLFHACPCPCPLWWIQVISLSLIWFSSKHIVSSVMHCEKDLLDVIIRFSCATRINIVCLRLIQLMS